jgi:NADH-quinone oxidoreductase subunit L
MPFTFLTFTIGSLALAGFPPFSGFFSKDEVLAFAINRGGGYVVLAVVGYLAAGLTAFYAFRMVFRVFFRAPVPEARELQEGHLAHHEPENPMSGEPEDTDVGFPGPEHHIAEQEWPMKVAMGTLAVLALLGGLVQVPGVSDTIEHFLEPTFADSKFRDTAPSDGAELIGLVVGALISTAGIAAAYLVFLRRRSLRLELRERFDRLHTFLVNKWYFDELYDLLFVRPMAAGGRFCRRVVEIDFVQGMLVGGVVDMVRAGTSFARSIQTGYLRAYALVLVLGVSGLGLYFLIVSS